MLKVTGSLVAEHGRRRHREKAGRSGDSVLFFTDGITEGRSHVGEVFGTDRLADLWSLHTGSGLLPDEILRRLVEAVTGFNAGKLRDDASLLQISWFGPTGRTDRRLSARGTPESWDC